jgi:hypothetical protein
MRHAREHLARGVSSFKGDDWGCGAGLELYAEVGDGMKGKAAYRGGVRRLHFSTEGVIRRDLH